MIMVGIGLGNDLCLFSAKPLVKPLLTYCQLDPKEQISAKDELRFWNFHPEKCIWKYHVHHVSPPIHCGNTLYPLYSISITSVVSQFTSGTWHFCFSVTFMDNMTSLPFFAHATTAHDDVIKWKHFSHYWHFVQGIHWSPVNSPHKDRWCRA